jgi:hypothetical protein
MFLRRIRAAKGLKMKATPQFQVPATVGACVSVITTGIAGTGWLPQSLSTPEVAAAVAGLTVTLASSFASYLNAIYRERRRAAEEGSLK